MINQESCKPFDHVYTWYQSLFEKRYFQTDVQIDNAISNARIWNLMVVNREKIIYQIIDLPSGNDEIKRTIGKIPGSRLGTLTIIVGVLAVVEETIKSRLAEV